MLSLNPPSIQNFPPLPQLTSMVWVVSCIESNLKTQVNEIVPNAGM